MSFRLAHKRNRGRNSASELRTQNSNSELSLSQNSELRTRAQNSKQLGTQSSNLELRLSVLSSFLTLELVSVCCNPSSEVDYVRHHFFDLQTCVCARVCCGEVTVRVTDVKSLRESLCMYVCIMYVCMLTKCTRRALNVVAKAGCREGVHGVSYSLDM